MDRAESKSIIFSSCNELNLKTRIVELENYDIIVINEIICVITQYKQTEIYIKRKHYECFSDVPLGREANFLYSCDAILENIRSIPYELRYLGYI